MTSYEAPDYCCTVAMEPADFEVLAGKHLEIRIRREGKARALRGMMIIPRPVEEDGGLRDAWLWLNAKAARLPVEADFSAEILDVIDWRNIQMNPDKVTQGVGKTYKATITKPY